MRPEAVQIGSGLVDARDAYMNFAHAKREIVFSNPEVQILLPRTLSLLPLDL